MRRRRAWRQPFRLWPAGVGAWLGAVVLGMVFRVVSGQGTAPAFIGVALAFLGLFLLGWRLLARLRGGRSGADRRPGQTEVVALQRPGSSERQRVTSRVSATRQGGP